MLMISGLSRIAVFAIATVPIMSLAAASEIKPGIPQVQQEIHSAPGNLCLDGDTKTIGANGTVVQAWSCGGGPNQKWRFRPGGTIQNIQSGRCLDAFAPTASTNGGKIVLWDCNGGPTQIWQQSGGQFVLASNPAKCLDNTAQTARTNGSRIQIWDCNHSPQQTWTPSVVISETMTDRCSAEVIIGFGPTNLLKSVSLVRRADETTNWSSIFEASLDDGHFLSWFCHSTKGNWLDPGTWRFINATTGCQESGDDTGDTPQTNALCSTTANVVTNNVSGWTPERSRCGSRTSFFQARLGPDRLLEIRCIQP